MHSHVHRHGLLEASVDVPKKTKEAVLIKHDPKLPEEFENVHTEHCCFKHGCKYSYDDCCVALGFLPQSFPCEACTEWFSYGDTTEY